MSDGRRPIHPCNVFTLPFHLGGDTETETETDTETPNHRIDAMFSVCCRYGVRTLPCSLPNPDHSSRSVGSSSTDWLPGSWQLRVQFVSIVRQSANALCSAAMPVKTGVDSHGKWTFDEDAVVYRRFLRAHEVRDGILYKIVDVWTNEDEKTSHRVCRTKTTTCCEYPTYREDFS